MLTKEEKRREWYLSKTRGKKRQRTIQLVRRIGMVCVAMFLIGLAVFFMARHANNSGETAENHQARRASSGFSVGFQQKLIPDAPDFEVELLTPNPYSRPQTALEKVKGIVIHYTANPGTSAQQNRSYFEGLKDSHAARASSHFVVGMEGEIVQCIPSSEISYASNDRNKDTLSIECCHPDDTGQFTQDTYDSLVHLTAWLCGKFNLPVEQVIRHYDVTGKKCPLYYVENQEAWEKFKQDLQEYLDANGVEKEE